ncbi:hypothetical protein EDC02_5904 [Micromonospora sp. Llam0]|uniref:hypothetical protein n=1 Tax=Micromonospora sp. Llam0 TaxID=2485143 RepID=UPI000F4A0D93|nr:hypothetical protein [Micromonospora sp. Llam0]ROO51040.1 hypothetical protein EDC02_5904 [Micromonospora sp. Llam0]
MSIAEQALTESRTLRAQHATRVDVLDRVKALTLLPDGVHATIDIVAGYYGVDADAVESVVRRNRDELAENGLRVIRGTELREFDSVNLTESKNRRALTLFTRRTILNVGQLLTGSAIAQRVRAYLLDVEEIAPADLRHEAIERAAISHAQVRVLRAAEGLVDQAWLRAKTKVVIARGLGEEPELDPADKPLYVPDYLRERGVTSKRDLASIQSWFGRRLVALAEADGIELPETRTSELPNGQLRETRAWTERHRPLFDAVWSRWYAADYDDRPAVLTA